MKPEDLLLDDTFLAWYFKSDNNEWRRWERLRKEDPVIRMTMDDAVRIIESVRANHPPEVGEKQKLAAHKKLMERIDQWEGTRDERRLPLFNRNRIRTISLAASVILFLVVGRWLVTKNDDGSQLYFAESGKTKRIELSDGSHVDLNGGSTLKASLLSGKGREVWLTGEAYFRISKQVDGEKFVVHSGDLTVEVLGTEFNVRENEEKTEVVLETGKVQLRQSKNTGLQQALVMIPGEMAEFSKTEGTISKREVNTRRYTSWKDGTVIFENADVNEMADILASRYGLRVEVQEGCVLGEFNGIFPLDDPHLVVTALEKTYEGKIVRRGQSIVFKK